MLSTVLIGLSLSMDAFAVSVCSGISIRELRAFHAVRASLFFGLFQFIMPVAGWFLGKTFISYIQAFDHWIAFGLLALIGGKMVWEAGQQAAGRKGTADTGPDTEKPVPSEGGADIRSMRILLTLAVATSIDALAVGFSFSILNRGIWGPATIIGGVTFAVCLTGVEFGRRVGLVFKQGAQMLGGFILIGIGIKILIEHLGAV
jgi:putative Mn2+ efflux pump MntP